MALKMGSDPPTLAFGRRQRLEITRRGFFHCTQWLRNLERLGAKIARSLGDGCVFAPLRWRFLHREGLFGAL